MSHIQKFLLTEARSRILDMCHEYAAVKAAFNMKDIKQLVQQKFSLVKLIVIRADGKPHPSFPVETVYVDAKANALASRPKGFCK